MQYYFRTTFNCTQCVTLPIQNRTSFYYEVGFKRSGRELAHLFSLHCGSMASSFQLFWKILNEKLTNTFQMSQRNVRFRRWAICPTAQTWHEVTIFYHIWRNVCSLRQFPGKTGLQADVSLWLEIYNSNFYLAEMSPLLKTWNKCREHMSSFAAKTMKINLFRRHVYRCLGWVLFERPRALTVVVRNGCYRHA